MPHPTTSPSFSRVVSLLRFPLILLVIAIHALGDSLRTLDSGSYIYIYISELFSHGIARIAVPLFFLFSGYYTFYRKDWSQPTTWQAEWKKKARSLLLPYLLWNTLYLLILLGKTQLTLLLGGTPQDPFFLPEIGQLISYYWSDVIVYPLWYVRELLALTLLTPLLYQLLRWARGWILLPLLVLYVAGWDCGIAGLGTVALFFFLLGGWAGGRGLDPLPRLYPYRFLLAGIALPAVLALPMLSGSPIHYPLEQVYVLTGGAVALLIGKRILETRPRLAEWLLDAERYVFFVYAVHTVLLVNWARGLIFRVPFLREESPGGLLGYFLLIALTLGLSLLVYALLRRIAPRVLSVLCGGR